MQKGRKAKRKTGGHHDIQSPRRDKATPAEDSIRPINEDKFPNKTRLLTYYLCWHMPRKMMIVVRLTVPSVGRHGGGDSYSHSEARPSFGFNQFIVIRVNKVI